MTERDQAGLLDTCTYLDLGLLDAHQLPAVPEISTVTLAELHQGVAMARDASSRAARSEQLQAAVAHFDALPFDDAAAARFGTLVALTLAAGRHPRPRRLDLMIAAVASSRGLAFYTRNASDFIGLDDAVRVVAV